jgi:hypothetical protein
MSKRPTAPNAPDIRTLAMMLDYAILEGTELRLPLFVLLLRAAQIELANCIDADGPAPVESHPPLTPLRALAAQDEAAAGSPSSLQDR